MIVGVIAGFGAILFRLLISSIRDFFVFLISGMISVQDLWLVLLPGLGGVLVASIVYYVASGAKGHGIPEIIHAVNLQDGRMNLKDSFVKIFASGLTIGTGGSAGREGPIAHIGGSFGSLLGQKLKLNANDIKVLVLSGVASGTAATFNAPIGGVLFSLEVIPRDKKAVSIAPMVISSVISTTISDYFLGQNPAFIFPQLSLTVNHVLHNIYIILGIGIVAGIYSIFWVKGFYIFQDWLNKLPLHPILLAGLGGLGVGIIEIWYPQVDGITYLPINEAFNIEISFAIAFVLIFLKFLATSLSIGSGGSGGVFMPTLFQGVMLGMSLGYFFSWLNILGIPIPLVALLGMAALFAAASRAPLTAVVMTSEMVNDYQLLLPLMFVVMTSMYISKMGLSTDIYVEKLKRRGLDFQQAIDMLQETQIHEIMVKPVVVNKMDRLEDVMSIMEETKHTGYPVVDNDGQLFGVITEHDILRALNSVVMKDWGVGRVCTQKLVTVTELCTVAIAMAKMAEKNINRLPVIDFDNPQILKGWVTRSDIMRFYRQEKLVMLRNEEEERVLRTFDMGKLGKQ